MIFLVLAHLLRTCVYKTIIAYKHEQGREILGKRKLTVTIITQRLEHHGQNDEWNEVIEQLDHQQGTDITCQRCVAYLLKKRVQVFGKNGSKKKTPAGVFFNLFNK